MQLATDAYWYQVGYALETNLKAKSPELSQLPSRRRSTLWAAKLDIYLLRDIAFNPFNHFRDTN